MLSAPGGVFKTGTNIMRKLGSSSFEGLLFPPIISHCNSIENTCKVLRADKVFRTTLFILHLGSENMSTSRR